MWRKEEGLRPAGSLWENKAWENLMREDDFRSIEKKCIPKT